MLKGFKEFLMRGNIVDLAVAVVIGTAFAKVVETFVSKIVTPLLNAMPGATTSGWGWQLTDRDNTLIDLSAIINALIVFLMTAAVVYFVFVVPMKRVKELRGTVEVAAPTTEDLLVEIRDELRAGRR